MNFRILIVIMQDLSSDCSSDRRERWPHGHPTKFLLFKAHKMIPKTVYFNYIMIKLSHFRVPQNWINYLSGLLSFRAPSTYSSYFKLKTYSAKPTTFKRAHSRSFFISFCQIHLIENFDEIKYEGKAQLLQPTITIPILMNQSGLVECICVWQWYSLHYYLNFNYAYSC